MALIWRSLEPVAITKKSAMLERLRRSRMTTSSARLSAASRATALANSRLVILGAASLINAQFRRSCPLTQLIRPTTARQPGPTLGGTPQPTPPEAPQSKAVQQLAKLFAQRPADPGESPDAGGILAQLPLRKLRRRQLRPLGKLPQRQAPLEPLLPNPLADQPV